MYNEIKLNITGKVALNMTLEEQQALLAQIERQIKHLLDGYGVENIKYNDYITHVVYIDDDWNEGKLI